LQLIIIILISSKNALASLINAEENKKVELPSQAVPLKEVLNVCLNILKNRTFIIS